MRVVSHATIQKNSSLTLPEQLTPYSLIEALQYTYLNPNTLTNFLKALKNNPLLLFVTRNTTTKHT